MPAPVTLQTAHTAELGQPALAAVRQLLTEAFDGELDDHDWDHTLGGMHALLWEGPEPIGHASVVQRRLLHHGRAWRTGYVEGVAVRADRRRRGHASALMAAVERVIRGGYQLGALGATEAATELYAGRGWLRWRGPTSALTPAGITRTPDDDGGVYVLPVAAPPDLDGELTCDWRDGDLW